MTDKTELRKRLTPEQYDVVCNEATEPPFKNAYWDHHEPGIYVDIATGEPLFSSQDKFDSGSGWPSFTRPIDERSVKTRDDTKLSMKRTEVRSTAGDSHLGHVFDDGPGPSGQRFCINSAALRFVPVARLEAEGLGRFLPLFAAKPAKAQREVAILAGGCFWGMEAILRQVPGVLSTRVGYTGGKADRPGYAQVKTGETGHAEAIEVTFDPSVLSYRALLEQHFFKMHDPTTLNRQGNDIGSQYRSTIFVGSATQREVAEEVKTAVDRSGKWKRPIVTQIVPAEPFWPAEEYHQKYLEKNPGGYTCHFMRD